MRNTYVICLSDGSTWEVVGENTLIYEVNKNDLDKLSLDGHRPHNLERKPLKLADMMRRQEEHDNPEEDLPNERG